MNEESDLGFEMYDHPGVYVIICKATMQCYAGATARTIHLRLLQHFAILEAGTHCNRRLQRLWNRYGEAGFQVGVWNNFDNPDEARAEEKRLIRFYSEHGKCLNSAGHGA